MKERVPTRKVVALGMVVLMLVVGFAGFLIFAPQDVAGDNPFLGSVQVNDDPGADPQNNPDITVGPTGMIYAVWQDDRNTFDSDIFFSNSSDEGQTWGPNMKVDSGTGDQTNPAIAVSSSGALYVAWQDRRGGDWNITFANSTDGGAIWSPINIQINDDIGTTRQQNPDIVVDSTGKIHVVWEDKRNGDWDIFYSQSDDGGATWSPNIKISTGTANQIQWHSSIAVDLSDNIYVIWEDERLGALDSDIYFAKSIDSGASFSHPNIKVNDGSGVNQYYPSISVDSGGTLYAAWEDYRNINADIYFSSSQNGGDTWSTDVRVNDNTYTSFNQNFPRISAIVGSISVVWEDFRNGDADVFFANSTDFGTTWTDPNIRVNDDLPGYEQHQPDVVISPISQTIFVAYEDDRFGDLDIMCSSLITVVTPPTVDYFFISRSPTGPLWAEEESYKVYEEDVFYAVGWNISTNSYAGPVSVNWGITGDIGTVTPGSGTSTTFNASTQGTGRVTADGLNETGLLTVTGGGIDRIFISLTPTPTGVSDWIGDQYYIVSDTQTFYAVGWNDTNNEIVSPVDVTWTSTDTLVGDVTTPGTSTIFSANGDGTCIVNATSDTWGSNETGILTVTSYDIDRIFISLSPTGASDWIGDQSYPIDDTDIFYACGWNDTSNVFVKLVDASWSNDAPSVGDVDAQGTSTTFSALGVGTTMVTASNATYGSNQTGTLTVFELEIDEILISRSSDGTGGWVDSGTYWGSDNTDIFYSTSWNSSYSEFLGLVDATWTISDDNVGTVDASGLWINFTAFEPPVDTSCFVTVSYSGFQNVTGILNILAPDIDYIIIRDTADNLGDVLDTAEFEVDDTATYHAAGYNNSVGYLWDVSGATWSATNSIGSFDPVTGGSTTFTATDHGVGKIMVSFNGITNESGNITITDIAINDIYPPQPTLEVKGNDQIEISWPSIINPDIKSIVIQRSTNENGPWIDITTLGYENTTYLDLDLNPDTSYYYRTIYLDFADNPSNPSPSVFATTEKEGDGNGDGDFPWILIILLIVIIIVVVFLLIFMMKKKGTSGGGEAEI